MLTPTSGTLSLPSGIAAGGDGRMYVASSGNATLAAVDGAGNFTFTTLLPGSQPWQVASAGNGVFWLSDQSNTRLLRVSPDPAPAVQVAPTPPAPAAQPPRLTLSGPTKQHLGSYVRVKARCADASCKVTATGRLVVRSSAGKTKSKLKKAGASLAAGKAKLLKLKLPAKAKSAAGEALARGGKVTAIVSVKARPASGGPASTKTLRIALIA